MPIGLTNEHTELASVADDFARRHRLLERARELGLRVTGFESMCAIPLCLKPDGLGEYEQLSGLAAGLDRGESWLLAALVASPNATQRATARRGCALARAAANRD